MLTIPSAAEQLFLQFSTAFTQPTFQRILPLAIGAIITIGRRTVTAVLWTMRSVIDGHCSTYHRIFSRASWLLWPLGKVLAAIILQLIGPDEPVLVPIDDTTAQHRGKHALRQGLPSRCSPFGSQTYSLSLGASVNSAGHFGKIPIYFSPMGFVGTVRTVSIGETQPC